MIGVARGVELVRAVLLRVGPAPGRGEPARERHPRQRAQRAGRVRARRPRPPAGFGGDRDHLRVVVRERDDEVVEVVLELRDDHARRHGAGPYPPPIGVSGEVELRHGFPT